MNSQFDEAAPASEFTSDWARFEEQLAKFLARFAQCTDTDGVTMRYPTGTGANGEILLMAAFEEPETIAQPGEGYAVVVARRGGESRLYRLAVGSRAMPMAARDICEFLREQQLVPHPSMLTADGEGDARRLLSRLQLPRPALVLHEIASRSTVTWPQTVEERREAVERELIEIFGVATMDADRDYVIDTSAEGGTRFYLNVTDDRPFVVFRKTVVPYVNSRRSAVVEANYLNRGSQDIRWVLRDHTLYQEYSYSMAPFVPQGIAAMLELFASLYRFTVAELRMRLGGDD